MNVLLRSHDDAEQMSLGCRSAPCNSNSGKVEPKGPRRHINCGPLVPTQSVDISKSASSRSRSCSPVRRLLKTVVACSQGNNSAAATRKLSILFHNSDNCEDPVDPTEAGSLDLSHDDFRDNSFRSSHNSSAGQQPQVILELPSQTDEKIQPPSKEKAKANLPPPSASNSVIPFPPSESKLSRRRGRRRRSRTAQEWEDLVALHQKMTNTRAPHPLEPLTQAVLHRRILEHKGLNARKLRFRIANLGAPPETKVQSKLTRRKSLPAAGGTPNKQSLRRCRTVGVNSSPDLEKMEERLRQTQAKMTKALAIGVPKESSSSSSNSNQSSDVVSPPQMKPETPKKDAPEKRVSLKQKQDEKKEPVTVAKKRTSSKSTTNDNTSWGQEEKAADNKQKTAAQVKRSSLKEQGMVAPPKSETKTTTTPVEKKNKSTRDSKTETAAPNKTESTKDKPQERTTPAAAPTEKKELAPVKDKDAPKESAPQCVTPPRTRRLSALRTHSGSSSVRSRRRAGRRPSFPSNSNRSFRMKPTRRLSNPDEEFKQALERTEHEDIIRQAVTP